MEKECRQAVIDARGGEEKPSLRKKGHSLMRKEAVIGASGQ
jgi:hypothetical protein